MKERNMDYLDLLMNDYIENSRHQPILNKVISDYSIDDIIDAIGIEKVENAIRMRKIKNIIS